MSRAQLHASLALWILKHKYRAAKLERAHKKKDQAAIKKWWHLSVESSRMIKRRRAQIAALPASVKTKRQRIVAACNQSEHNYNQNPRAYHYLAGGKPNTIIMAPTPPDWRSDCSQYAVNTYRVAGVPCPGSGTYLYSNTGTIAARGRITFKPKPGDLGMYAYSKTNPRGTTHHVEVYQGGTKFVGHGSPPIDSITPGWPTFFLTFLD